MLKVGLIGCGGMGNTHAGAYAVLKDLVKVVAIADEDIEKAKKLADQLGAEQVFTSGEELINSIEADFIDICLPTVLHTKHAVMAMEKGFDLFMEKPVCLNEEEAQLLLSTQEKTGAKIQIGQVIRFWDEYVWLKNVVDNGTYGKVVAANFQRLSAFPKWCWNDWYADAEKSGTAALDLHIHDVDFIRYLMGEPKNVSSLATRDKDGMLMHITTNYEYDDAMVTAEGGWDFPDCFPFTAGYRVKLEKATVIYNADGVTVYPAEGEPFKAEIEKTAFDDMSDLGLNVSSLGGYFNELKYFVEKMSAGETPNIAPLSEAIKSAQLVWKEIESAGGKVK